jgi:hypothetical protein
MSTVAAGIAALFASGGKFAHLAKKGAQLVKVAESNPAALVRLDESIAEATREMLKDCYATAKALVAYAIDREPSDPEVDALMAEVTEHPNAPFRMHRILGEARKSASRRRRRFLASVFFGLPFSTLPDDERDRVDMAVERMTVPDVQFLDMIAAKRNSLGEQSGRRYIFGPDGILAMIDGITLRIGTPTEWVSGGFADEFYKDPQFIGDRAALSSLVSVGCLDVGQSRITSLNGNAQGHQLRILPLGDMVLRAIEEVRSGFRGATE